MPRTIRAGCHRRTVLCKTRSSSSPSGQQGREQRKGRKRFLSYVYRYECSTEPNCLVCEGPRNNTLVRTYTREALNMVRVDRGRRLAWCFIYTRTYTCMYTCMYAYVYVCTLFIPPHHWMMKMQVHCRPLGQDGKTNESS